MDEERRRVVVTKEDMQEVVDVALLRHAETARMTVAAIVNEAIDRHMTGDAHAYVRTMIVKEQRRQELWESTRKHVMGWGAVAVIIYLLSSTWDGILSHIR